MLWQPLRQFRDRSVPKLHNLRRAAAAGLRVPPTWLAERRWHERLPPPPGPAADIIHPYFGAPDARARSDNLRPPRDTGGAHAALAAATADVAAALRDRMAVSGGGGAVPGGGPELAAAAGDGRAIGRG